MGSTQGDSDRADFISECATVEDRLDEEAGNEMWPSCMYHVLHVHCAALREVEHLLHCSVGCDIFWSHVQVMQGKSSIIVVQSVAWHKAMPPGCTGLHGCVLSK